MDEAKRRWLVGFALLVLVFAIGFIQRTGAFAPFDQAIMLWVGAVRPSPLGEEITGPAIWLSIIGDTKGRLFLLTVAALLLVRLRRWRQWVWLAAVVIAVTLLNNALKYYFGAARPELIPHLDPTTSFSFPSGHASGNMTFLAALAALAARRWAWLLAGLLIVAIGCTRVWLGVHWPTDVICGWMEGAAVVLFALRWLPARPEVNGRKII